MSTEIINLHKKDCYCNLKNNYLFKYANTLFIYAF